MGTGGRISGLPSSKRSFVSRQPPHVSFEFFPPKTPAGWDKLKETASHLAEFEPDFTSVTFGAGGSGNFRTLEACLAVRSVLAADVVPHLSCIGQTRDSIDAHLAEFTTQVSHGFSRSGATSPSTPKAQKFRSLPAASATPASSSLSSRAVVISTFSSVVYPEGHPEAPSLQADIDNFIRKVEAGADAAVTQYFFNNAGYFHFVDEVRRRGLDIPIVVGLMPIWPYEQVVRFSGKCGADVPLWIRKRMEGYKDDPKSQFEFAVEVAVTQSEELLRNGAPGIHFYTLNRPEATVRTCESLRGQKIQRGPASMMSPMVTSKSPQVSPKSVVSSQLSVLRHNAFDHYVVAIGR